MKRVALRKNISACLLTLNEFVKIPHIQRYFEKWAFWKSEQKPL